MILQTLLRHLHRMAGARGTHLRMLTARFLRQWKVVSELGALFLGIRLMGWSPILTYFSKVVNSSTPQTVLALCGADV